MKRRRAKAPSKRAMQRRKRQRVYVWRALATYTHEAGYVRVWSHAAGGAL